MLRKHYDVLFLDCTYKTNKFKMPLLHITGVTCLGTNFEVALCFLPDEKQASYEIALDSLQTLCGIAGVLPRVFITDKEAALKNALRRLWPNIPQRLCSWHVFNNLKTHAIERWDNRKGETEEEKARIEYDRSLFLGSMSKLIHAASEENFWEEWRALQQTYDKEPRLIGYIAHEWIPCREEWATAWCQLLPDFGHK